MNQKTEMPDDKCHPYCDIADTDRYFFVNKINVVQLKRKEIYAEKRAHFPHKKLKTVAR